MSRPLTRLLFIGLALTILAACSQAPGEPQPFSVSGDGVGLDASPSPVLAAGTVFLDPDSLPILTSPVAASLIEVEEGVYVGPLSQLGPSGEVTLVFPAADELPSAILKPAESFVYEPFGLGCTLVASDPTARVTATGMGGVSLTFPTVVFYMVEGAEPGIVLSQEVTWPPTDPTEIIGLGFQTWAYADKPVAVATDPQVCGDATSPPILIVDVELESGWNALEWVYLFDEFDVPIGIQLQNSSAEDVFFYFGFFL